ncbi:transposase [Streptomyces flavidovirens]
MDAILYENRLGTPRDLPRDFPPWATAYGCFAT